MNNIPKVTPGIVGNISNNKVHSFNELKDEVKYLSVRDKVIDLFNKHGKSLYYVSINGNKEKVYIIGITSSKIVLGNQKLIDIGDISDIDLA